MNRVLIIISFMVCSVSALAQTPGGVGTANLTAWFSPDALPNGNVLSWPSTFPVGTIQLNDNAFPYPQATETPAGDVSNYNKTITFLNNSWAQLQALQLAGQLDLLDNSTAASQGTFFCAYYLPGATQNGHMVLYNETGNDAIQFRNLGANGRLALGKNMFISENAAADWPEDNLPNIISYQGNRTGANTMSSFKRALDFNAGGASQSSGPAGLYFGMKPNTATSAYEGYLYEVIFFNTDLSAAEMDRVHSYLAIKYGITLDNTGGGTQGDYVSTTNLQIWDADNSPEFHTDVIGIARDDSQGLLQKQSHTFNDVTRIYLSDLEAANSLNTGTVINDVSYVTIGHNDLPLCGTNLEVPEEIAPAVRLEREWKVTKTNFTQEFNLDFTLGQCGDLTDVDLDRLRILLDTDSDLSDADVYGADSGLDFTLNGSTITISGISETHIPDNSTRFITLAVIVPEVTIIGLDEICSGIDVELTFEINNTTEPLTFQLFDGDTATDITDVQNGEGVTVTPIQTTTYSILTPLETVFCCGAQSSWSGSLHTIVVSAGLEIDLGPDFTLCQGETALLDAGVDNATYTWNNILGAQELEVSTAGEYTVEVSSDGGCEGSDAVIVSLEMPPNAGANGIIALCNSQSEFNLSSLLSAGSDNNGEWEEVTSLLPAANLNGALITLTDAIAGSVQMYYISVGQICDSDSSLFQIEIMDQPVAGANATINLCSSDPSLNLNDLLSAGADPGTWQEVSNVPSGQFVAITGGFVPSGLQTGTYEFLYETNEVEPCPVTTAMVTIELTESPMPEFTTSIESGCLPLSVTFTNNTPASDACLWTFGDGFTENSCGNVNYEYQVDGCFDVELEVSLNGCVSVVEYQDLVCVFPVPEALFSATPQSVFSDNPVVEFENLSEGATLYEWSFGDEETSLLENVTHLYPNGVSGFYSVILTAENDFGCTSTYSEVITVEDAINVFVPNAFTPDFDGINDVFKPVIGAGFDSDSYVFQIYNRLGELIFETTDYDQGWIGGYERAMVQDGIYNWRLSFKSLYSSLVYEREGSVAIFR